MSNKSSEHKLHNKKLLEVGFNQTETKFVQSANTLFSFMGEINHLLMAIEKMEMFPLYFKEDVDYLELKLGNRNIHRVAFPMLCFCDINMHRLQAHVGQEKDNESNKIIDGYGHYGIGLDKAWCIKQGFQPITYINPLSTFRIELTNVLNDGLNKVFLDQEIDELYLNYVLRQLTLIKPLNGKMNNRLGIEITKNFHDEKEWRYTPNLSNVSSPEFINDATMANFLEKTPFDNLNKGLLTESGVHLKINVDIIKYLFVDTLADKDKLISKLIELYPNDQKIAMELATKILVYEQIAEDW